MASLALIPHQAASAAPPRIALGGEVTDVHQKDEHQGHDGSVEPELGSALDHLRDAQFRTLGGVSGHERDAKEVADKQGEQGPRQRQPDDDSDCSGSRRSNLHVRPEPDEEKPVRRPMPFRGGNIVNRAALDL